MSKPLKNILENFINKTDDKFILFKNWHHVTGHLSTKIRLEKIYEDTCIIGVYDSAWMQELYLMSKIIINKINKTLNENNPNAQKVIKNLRFKLIEEKKVKPEKNNLKPVVSGPEKRLHISGDIKKEIEKLKDNDLQALIENYLLMCLRNNEEL